MSNSKPNLIKKEKFSIKFVILLPLISVYLNFRQSFLCSLLKTFMEFIKNLRVILESSAPQIAIDSLTADTSNINPLKINIRTLKTLKQIKVL